MDAVSDRLAATSAYAWAAVGRGREPVSAAATVEAARPPESGLPVQGDARAPISPSAAGREAAIQQSAQPSVQDAAQPGLKELTDQQLQQLRDLQQRDREVRQHEQAHLAAAGGLAMSGATYTMERGPDGQSYAVGGEVQISMSPGRTPEETIQRAATIMAAATAPAEPSGQDRAVAAQARQMRAQAVAEQLAAQLDARAPAGTGTASSGVESATQGVAAISAAPTSGAASAAVAVSVDQASKAIQGEQATQASVASPEASHALTAAAITATGSMAADQLAEGQGLRASASTAVTERTVAPGTHPGAQSAADGLNMYRQLANPNPAAQGGAFVPEDTGSRLIRVAA